LNGDSDKEYLIYSYLHSSIGGNFYLNTNVTITVYALLSAFGVSYTTLFYTSTIALPGYYLPKLSPTEPSAFVSVKFNAKIASKRPISSMNMDKISGT